METSPTSTGFTKFLLLAVLAVSVLGGVGLYFHHRSAVWAYYHSPQHTLAVLDQIRTLEDVDRNSAYLTATGKRLVASMVQDPNHDAPVAVHLISQQIDARKASFRIRGGAPGKAESISNLLLLKDGDQWKFHDVWIETIEGKKANMMMSYTLDHPYAAALTMVKQNPELGVEDAKEAVRYFLAGYQIAQILVALVALL